ncbi:lipopolysaccharide export system protein LptC [Modicisalibacter ilicicola DSM 19980]|uniref:Lipopolysaccharide export system protein LptC n=1 Tax=Modicisalibacter ilicicola DSM 19980 TaxID=1121942 RepID=A0A1M5C827_9GAMM|nr:LPS export ABC transporter periplasmic protein LptC [Halomonas ilicicola]SHF50908.1 lipopolysaccharide export system protein LptC [Halomonas ilicicola DSM 19980]
MALRIPRPPARLWLALLVLALGGVLTVIEQRDVSLPGPVPTDAAGEPDFYLEGARMTRFDAQGKPHQRLETPRLVHTPADDVIRATTPDIRLYDDEGRTWFASADKGRLGPGGNPLTLEGDAWLEAPDEGWRLDTEVLVYDTEEGHAWSESEARLSQHQQRVRGERFDAWIDEARMRLTDNVRGVHPPIDKETDS